MIVNNEILLPFSTPYLNIKGNVPAGPAKESPRTKIIKPKYVAQVNVASFICAIRYPVPTNKSVIIFKIAPTKNLTLQGLFLKLEAPSNNFPNYIVHLEMPM